MSKKKRKVVYMDTNLAQSLAFNKYQEKFLELVEQEFPVTIANKGNTFQVIGQKEFVKPATALLEDILRITKKEPSINPLELAKELGIDKNVIQISENEKTLEEMQDVLIYNTRNKLIKPKTEGQKQYIHSIKNNAIVFGIGPAGTGKTFLAVVMARLALKYKKVSRIILVRPTVEAGEKLGFLPGDIQEKVNPYFRPLYDALFEILEADKFQRYLEQGIIEIAPLAFMRGRTLNDAFIILDEAQNTTLEQMKMFLTRLGFYSQAVITGDITQIDLPDNKESGLIEALKILRGIEDIAFVYFTEADIVRHKIVLKIIDAYKKNQESKSQRVKDLK